MLGREFDCHDGRIAAVTVFHDVQEVASLVRGAGLFGDHKGWLAAMLTMALARSRDWLDYEECVCIGPSSREQQQGHGR
jgi:hypothetical protein